MPAMKLTPTAAMRARDVSRPRAEHFAEAETAEAARTARRAAPDGRRPEGVSPTGGDEGSRPAAREGRRPARGRKVSRK